MEERMETEYENEGFHKSPYITLSNAFYRKKYLIMKKKRCLIQQIVTSSTQNCFIVQNFKVKQPNMQLIFVLMCSYGQNTIPSTSIFSKSKHKNATTCYLLNKSLLVKIIQHAFIKSIFSRKLWVLHTPHTAWDCLVQLKLKFKRCQFLKRQK